MTLTVRDPSAFVVRCIFDPSGSSDDCADSVTAVADTMGIAVALVTGTSSAGGAVGLDDAFGSKLISASFGSVVVIASVITVSYSLNVRTAFSPVRWWITGSL